MTSTATGYADQAEQAVTATDLLALVRAHRAVADQAEASIVQLKTHTRWRYTQVAPDKYLWSDPHEQLFLHGLDGTTNLTTS